MEDKDSEKEDENKDKKERNFKEGFTALLKKTGRGISITTSGMGMGLFGTTIVATVFLAFAKIPALTQAITTWMNAVTALMGASVGLGVALSLKKNPITCVAAMSCGAIGTFEFNFWTMKVEAINDPLSAYASVLFGLLFIGLIMRKKTILDLILVPLIGIGFSLLYSFLFAFMVHSVTLGLADLIQLSSNASPVFMCIMVSLIVGLSVTAPISSVAVCLAVNIQAILTPANTGLSIAAGAGLIGCCCNMVGLGVESVYDNGILGVFAVALGTPKIQFANILKKPVIWVPSILSSIFLGPLALLCQLTVDSVGAGMGTCGFVGLLNAYLYAPITWQRGLFIPLLTIIAPALLTFAIDFIFRKCNIIKKGDFKIELSF